MYYLRFIKSIESLGYSYGYRILNSADYGAHTARKRYFAVFAKKGLTIRFPDATHSKNPVKDAFGELKAWKPVKEVLNFEDEGNSIFTRKRPLSERTLERIYAGLLKFVGGGKESSKAFLTRYYSGHPDSKNSSINAPALTITTKDHHALVQANWIVKYMSNNPKTGINKGVSVNDPSPTVTCQGRLGLAKCNFLSTYYKNGSNYSVDSPSPTITTKDRIAKISCSHFLVNPQFGNGGASIEKPCFTLIASMNKRPPYLITVKGGLAIAIGESDSEMTVKIKEFMAAFGIFDIKLRMLRVQELKEITGFPPGYVLKGNQSNQKKFIGNAVPPVMAKVLTESLVSANF